ncbi:unnamed protein product [Lactuca saligna]|uniref:Uncharacterized protein n=1 Tax=Lactuca saligna TaxID=75948 RepID=A0AA35YIW2_LACSI|nr:unnamed protein product [Lactuca saligna]
MDICSGTNLSVVDIANDLHDLQNNPLESTHGVLKPLYVDELDINVTEFFNIQDDTNEDLNSSSPYEPKDTTTQAPDKCLSKSTTFPCLDSITSVVKLAKLTD